MATIMHFRTASWSKLVAGAILCLAFGGAAIGLSLQGVPLARIGVPVALGCIAIALWAIFDRDTSDAVADEGFQRQNRIWLKANLAITCLAAVGLAIGLKINVEPKESLSVPAAALIASLCGLVATVFVTGIPSRLLMNFVIPERRRHYLVESLVLLATWTVLAWALFIMRATDTGMS